MTNAEETGKEIKYRRRRMKYGKKKKGEEQYTYRHENRKKNSSICGRKKKRNVKSKQTKTRKGTIWGGNSPHVYDVKSKPVYKIT